MATQTFFIFHPYLGKMNPFWLIFFKWVETTNQHRYVHHFQMSMSTIEPAEPPLPTSYNYHVNVYRSVWIGFVFSRSGEAHCYARFHWNHAVGTLWDAWCHVVFLFQVDFFWWRNHGDWNIRDWWYVTKSLILLVLLQVGYIVVFTVHIYHTYIYGVIRTCCVHGLSRWVSGEPASLKQWNPFKQAVMQMYFLIVAMNPEVCIIFIFL